MSLDQLKEVASLFLSNKPLKSSRLVSSGGTAADQRKKFDYSHDEEEEEVIEEDEYYESETEPQLQVQSPANDQRSFKDSDKFVVNQVLTDDKGGNILQNDSIN